MVELRRNEKLGLELLHQEYVTCERSRENIRGWKGGNGFRTPHDNLDGE